MSAGVSRLCVYVCMCVSAMGPVCVALLLCVCGVEGVQSVFHTPGVPSACWLDASWTFFFFFSPLGGFFSIFSKQSRSPTTTLSHHLGKKQARKEGRTPPSGSSQAFRCLSGVFGFVLFCFLLRLQTRLMITSNNLLLIVVLCLERHFPQTRAVSVS